ncbi:MAG: glycosyl transferase [Alphaproteobacteria bacterium]|nr:glycosyl transferase [Alphaproteobacteria bacterium]
MSFRIDLSADSAFPPIRSDLFSVDRLEEHARSLAGAQPVGKAIGQFTALPKKLRQNVSDLTENFVLLAKAAKAGHPITSAGEWFLDNFHIVEEQARQVQRDLPASFYRELPKLTEGPLAGFPRVYGIAWALVAHTDSGFDMERLERFLKAYQQVSPLKIGELWAISITLRLVLVENIKRLTDRVVLRVRESDRADGMAQQALAALGDGAPARALERMAFSAATLARFERQLRDQGVQGERILEFVEIELAAQGVSSHEIIQNEYQAQSADDVSVRNVITAMRLVSSIDWTEFFESVSLVDGVLGENAGFHALDFTTRDRYRQSIERLARRAPFDEIQIARMAIEQAEGPAAQSARERDVGFWLIGKGRRSLEQRVRFAPSAKLRLMRTISGWGIWGYVSALAIVTALLVGAVLAAMDVLGAPAAWLPALAILALLPASELAVALVNRVATNRWRPEILPALELKDGVPESLSTVLVVPVLLGNEKDIAEQIERLEVHYFANGDAGLQFALLSDWVDSDAQLSEEDTRRLDFATARIAALNQRHARGEPLFLLLHRARLWNPSQNKWMGWERKRGKLHEFNRLLRGATDTSFIDPPVMFLKRRVRYVITLDADTRLPRGAARRLIGKMAHPLNQPEFNSQNRCISAGYGILQPRVTPSLPIGTESSIFQWAFSGPNGLDPYAFAVSDVYQDLFNEGSFVGKGIYDVDAFEKALEGRIPENTILSHDLLEGVFARAALVSDVEVVEEFPSRYDVEVSRQHRWVRGDWQLVPWIFGSGHTVPLLGRWKMLDNLRRSLTAPAMLLSFLLGWMLPHTAALAWTVFLTLVILLPPLLPIAAGVFPRQRGYSLRSHARSLARDTVLAVTQILFSVTFMARLAFLALDAITRTIFRLFVSRKNLLQWVTFAQSAYSRRAGWSSTLLQMAGSVTFVLVSSILIGMRDITNLWPALLFLTLWGFSPVLARWASQSPRVEPHLEMSDSDRSALRVAARRTWMFFERFVTTGDNALPPDNFQEDPAPVVAHRTSPTNIGGYLCSLLAAHDMGWIGTLATVERLEETFASLQKLERFRGHFMNWYDTASLRSLEPRYISTVDSGNLAGNLLVVKNGCHELASPPTAAVVRGGLADGLAMVRETIQAMSAGMSRSGLEQKLEPVARMLQGDGVLPGAWFANLQAAVQVLLDEAALGAPLAVQLAVSSLLHSVESHAKPLPPADKMAPRLAALSRQAGDFVHDMEFGFLFDETRQLLSIGYRLEDQALDANAYDLLASEARLASFLAIAKGDIPTRHWFRLGRTLTPLGRIPALQSWSGSMFEYLMPSLIMHEPTGSLINLSNRAAVRRQIRYASSLNIPWGISESQYNARDRDQNYQYSGFGVPDLGIKRGLGENTVVAPYATGLAAMVAPVQARRNLDRLTRVGALGDYGWYEAIDYTPARLPENTKRVVIRAYMAHHQGMMVLGLADVLNDGRMRERFHAEPMVQAAELLLQERMPRDVSVARLPPSMNTGAITYYDAEPRGPRTFIDPGTDTPRTHLLSNASYSVMLTVAGSGFSRWQGQAITRWREDATRDPWGSFIYLRDLRDGRTWSAGFQPVGARAEEYSVEFSEDRARMRRRDGVLETVTEITVSPEDDSEVRRITITNHGTRLREIEVTSYMELALAVPRDDDAHPAFSKLFVQTEYLRETGALIATRRPRSPTDKPIWAAHLSVVDGESVGDVQYETDRSKFLTRNKSARNAGSVMGGWPLSNTAGATLDPCFSLRRRIQLGRGKSVSIAFWTMAAASRKEILDLVDRHHDGAAFDRAMTLSATHSESQLQHLGISGDEPNLFQLLANAIIYMDPALRAPPEVLTCVAPAQVSLWPFGISGDLPIVLVRLQDEGQLGLVRQIVRAREYLRVKGLAFDLVIVNEREASYAQELQKALEGIVHANDRSPDDGLGHIQLVRTDLAGADGVARLRAVARVDLTGRRGSLEQQLAISAKDTLARDEVTLPTPPVAPKAAAQPDPKFFSNLRFFNSYGGFSADGREYVAIARAGRPTPAPWINVIANPDFGFQVSSEGAGFCWAANSQQNQITPWSNDPVTNESGDFLYLKDLDSGDVWSPVSTPIAHPSCLYISRHGQGYSRFETSGLWISSELTQFLPRTDGVRISRLKLRNASDKPRRLAVTQYVSWALGAAGTRQPFVQTWMDPQTRVLLARNPWNADFGERVGFLDMRGGQTAWTSDRREFLGRNGSFAAPAALAGSKPLSGQLGPALDACAVQQLEILLAPGEETEVVILLGQGRDAEDVGRLVEKYRGADLDAVHADVEAFWDETLGAIQVHTPDPAMDILVNRWLLYQTLSCRMWGRAGFYQVSGAYGFRDQLQDCMAMCVSRPDLAREQILRAAGRQFEEGDVQHWWLPESGKGIRTRISDDRAWLGYVTAYYIEVTQDVSILDEQLPFLVAPPLKEGEHDAFSPPQVTQETASLYEHCARALDASRSIGIHDLPLMGTGDWNDGMNRVGEQGKGESVWLGWFLHNAMRRFSPYAESRGDAVRVADWLVHMDVLRKGLEMNAWDGAWYRRAYFDDGFALGSAANRECRIDSIAQSWAVISGVAPQDKARQAMEAVDRYLVRTEDRLMTLFTPPFVDSIHDPGYIKGYPAGIRENGGQYTHGVLWSIVAYTMLGEGDRAGALFSMLNPINHARSKTQTERYRVEPYVACGDVYSVPPHVGRGGWTWYSGSAAWMYRVAVESILGLRLAGDTLLIAPVIPRAWPKFEATVRRGNATYKILVENPEGRCSGVATVSLDGKPVPFDNGIHLARDGANHEIHIVLGEHGAVST